MKKPTKYILSFISILLVILACTKQVGLYTEVEFELTETHESEGYVNTALTTVITVTPEELVDGYSYSYSYKINSGSGYFEDESGTIISEGEKIALDPLTASLNYIATEIGDHTIVFTAEDSFGFTEQVIATYSVTDIPVTWTASASTDQILLGASEAITVVLGSETEDEEVTYQRNYSFTEGTGTLTTSEGADETLNELVEITPGTYELEFIATELGSVIIEFLLEDSNGQEVIETINFEVVEELEQSDTNSITSFELEGITIDNPENEITITLPYGTDVSALIPTIEHNGASIYPNNTPQDFSSSVTYTVTAENDDTQEYIVTVELEVGESSSNDITSFELEGITIDNPENDFTITLPAGTDVSALTPTIEHNGASINPNNTPQDFSSSVTYIVTAEDSSTQEYIVTVELESGNEPTAENFDVTVDENSTSNLIDVTDKIGDEDGDTLTVTISSALNGTASISGTVISYTPTSGYSGNDQITYTVDDGSDSVNATISITVSPLTNNEPVANDVSISVEENSSSNTIDLTNEMSDIDGDTLTVTFINPANGTATISGTVISYTPTSGYSGNDQITYTVDDGTDSVNATITITVTALANNEPVANDVSISVEENSSSNTIDLTNEISDVDGDDLTVTIGSALNGTATISGTVISYTPTNGYSGNDQITYTVDDGTDSVNATISITVNALNQAPTAVATGPSSIFTGGTAQFYGDSSTDPDDDTLSYLWDFGDGGTSTEANPSHSYSTADDYTVILTINDGNGGTNSTTLTISVATPITFDSSTGEYTAPAGSTVTIILRSIGDMGKGDAIVNVDGVMIVSNFYNTIDSFSLTDEESFTMPESGSVVITGSHDNLYDSDGTVSYSSVNISNSESSSTQSLLMDINNGIPQ
ncbi:tandem-95 repeat protein [Cellulophaga baltica]|uniref:Ig-like domain-containing protein n=1 Tax=Cellulophaga TaxID=104264 RepID=UPI001C06AFB0|nr:MULTISPECIES: Ig-like domain-containing protein [Cellulophaga]MBU2997463.1 tandem-95 repeat protein [Cellulophaga baltica]MDO6768860.1 Ig-like domain-containing protein [Cellulophaga sp. 1_MG-2023]